MPKINKILLYIIFVCLVVILCCLFGGCSTEGHVDAATVLEYQRQIDRLEERIRSSDRTVESAARDIETITNRSETMGGTIDELIDLFAEYDRRVQQMLHEYADIRTEAETQKYNIVDTADGYHIEANRSRSRRDVIRERGKSTSLD